MDEQPSDRRLIARRGESRCLLRIPRIGGLTPAGNNSTAPEIQHWGGKYAFASEGLGPRGVRKIALGKHLIACYNPRTWMVFRNDAEQ